MYIRRWNTKRLSLVVCVCFVLYILFSSGFYKYQIDGVISNSKPEEVWNYVADFSKMRLLNPTILNFEIVSDSGNTHDWRYSVSYTERLSHWPYWLNTVKADYIITKTMPRIHPQSYAISSKHQTCFFRGAYCCELHSYAQHLFFIAMHAESEFSFSAAGKDTYCVENIQYQCPPFLGSACRRELEFQRKAVMHNLTMIFSKKLDSIQK